MKCFIFLCLCHKLMFLINGALVPDYGFNDPDYAKTTPELIASRGYPVETHYVETSDSYILGVHRIPNGNGYNGDANIKPVAFLLHGFLASSADFVTCVPNCSLACLLYDRGYDVWMGNVRGNLYSRNNSKISPNDAKFWKFSWDEMALIDLPAMVDYVLDLTKQKKLYLLGYSNGGGNVLAMLSDRPEYQEKVIAAALMAPLSSAYYATNPIFVLTPFKAIFSLPVNNGELFPLTPKSQSSLKTLCTITLINGFCKDAWKVITGSSKYLNESRVGVFLSHYPAGTSQYTSQHILQQKKLIGPIFQKFDFGLLGNMEKYKQASPPKYNLSAISNTSCGLFTSTGDKIIVQKDVDYIRNNVKNIKHDFVLQDEKFDHSDFYTTTKAVEVYTKIFEFWSRYN